MNIIDGKVWCNEVEKWVTPEEYEQNCKGVEYRLPGGWDIDWAFPLTNRGRSISLEVPPDWKERIK